MECGDRFAFADLRAAYLLIPAASITRRISKR